MKHESAPQLSPVALRCAFVPRSLSPVSMCCLVYLGSAQPAVRGARPIVGVLAGLETLWGSKPSPLYRAMAAARTVVLVRNHCTVTLYIHTTAHPPRGGTEGRLWETERHEDRQQSLRFHIPPGSRYDLGPRTRWQAVPHTACIGDPILLPWPDGAALVNAVRRSGRDPEAVTVAGKARGCRPRQVKSAVR